MTKAEIADEIMRIAKTAPWARHALELALLADRVREDDHAPDADAHRVEIATLKAGIDQRDKLIGVLKAEVASASANPTINTQNTQNSPTDGEEGGILSINSKNSKLLEYNRRAGARGGEAGIGDPSAWSWCFLVPQLAGAIGDRDEAIRAFNESNAAHALTASERDEARSEVASLKDEAGRIKAEAEAERHSSNAAVRHLIDEVKRLKIDAAFHGLEVSILKCANALGRIKLEKLGAAATEANFVRLRSGPFAPYVTRRPE